MISTLWNLCVRYWPDLVVAGVFAVIFAVIVDLLRISSRIREVWRWVKDKNAESTVVNINARIAELEQYRNLLQSYLASDKLLYLALLRSITGILLFMCVAGVLLIMGKMRAVQFPGAEIVALAAIACAIASGMSTMQLGSFDTSKISKLIEKVDTEIGGLKEARLKLQKPR
jgi:hypothetical protein